MTISQILACLTVVAVATIYTLGPGFRAQRIYGMRFSHAPVWWDGRPALFALTLVLAAVFTFTQWGSANLVLALPVVLFGPTLAVVDLAVHRLPNRINGLFAACAAIVLVLAWALDGDATRLLRAVCAAGFFGVVFLLSTFVRGGFGMGDVKLAPSAFGLAAAASLSALAVMVVVTFVGAGIAALVLLATRRAKLSTPLALGPWILLGLTWALASA